MKYNVALDVVVSVDQAGILEYWTGPKTDYKFPSKVVSFDSKMDTGNIQQEIIFSAVIFIFCCWS